MTYPIWLEYGSSDLIAWLFNFIYPSTNRLSDISLPERKLRRVVFPEPEGPKIAVKVDACMSPDCLCRMVLTSFLTLASILVS